MTSAAWSTPQLTEGEGHHSGLSLDEVKAICAEYRLHGERTLPDRFGVSRAVIRDIIYDYNWHDPNYILTAEQTSCIKYLLALGRSQTFIAAQLDVSRNVVARLLPPPDEPTTKIVRRL
jgi:hypothetical protein